jgi:hypothetical protein
MYEQAMAMTFCQKTVLGLLLFHLQDERRSPGGSPAVLRRRHGQDVALPGARSRVRRAQRRRRGVQRAEADPKVTLKRGKTTKTGLPMTINCSLDCSYVLRLDAGGTLKGLAIGSTPKTVLFHGHLRPGAHVVTATATATMNAGPPRTVRLAFRL